MDPVSLAASITGLILFAKEIGEISAGYITHVANAKKEAQELHEEAKHIVEILQRVKSLLTDPNTALVFMETSFLFLATSKFQDLLESTRKTLETELDDEKHIWNKIKWPFKEGKHQNVLRDMRRYMDMYQMSLQIDGLKLLSKTSDAVFSQLRAQSAQLIKIKTPFPEIQVVMQKIESVLTLASDVASSLTTLSEDVKSVSTKVDRISDHQHLSHIYQQLSEFSDYPYKVKYNRAIEYWTPATGSWFLSDAAFLSWVDPASDTCELWGVGEAGVGKTTLSSIVVEYLQSSESPAQVAVFYCEESYDAKCILRSVLCQLIESQLAELTSDSIIVKKLNALCKGPGPTDRQLKDALVLTGNSNSCVSFIVIDALDELEDEQRTKLMETISQLVSKTLRVLITCRPGCKETNRLATVINVASHENDVRLFLEQRVEDTLNRREILARQINAEKRARIVDHIARQTGKLFLLARLQVDYVLDCRYQEQVFKALRETTPDIDTEFKRTIRRINAQDAERRDIGSKALFYMAYAERPLTLLELCDAVTLEPGNDDLNRILVPSPELLVRSCLGLISIHENDNTVGFTHPSVKRFLLDPTNKAVPGMESPEKVREKILGVCITQLSMPSISSAVQTQSNPIFRELPHWRGIDYISDESSFARAAKRSSYIRFGGAKYPEPLFQRYHFLSYAIRFWLSHTIQSRSEAVAERVLLFISNEEVFQNVFSPQLFSFWGCLDIVEGDQPTLINRRRLGGESILPYDDLQPTIYNIATFLGLTSVLRLLLSGHAEQLISQADDHPERYTIGDPQTALRIAVDLGWIEGTKAILAAVPPNVESSEIAYSPYEIVMSVIITDRGRGKVRKTRFRAIFELMVLLPNHGWIVDPDTATVMYRYIHKKLLCLSGFVQPVDDWPIHWGEEQNARMFENGSRTLLERILRACFIEMREPQGSIIAVTKFVYKNMFLHEAAWMGHDDACLFFIERGADIEFQSTRDISAPGLDEDKGVWTGLTPLLAACLSSRKESGKAVKVLLYHGANITAVDDGDRNSLWFAVESIINVVTDYLEQGWVPDGGITQLKTKKQELGSLPFESDVLDPELFPKSSHIEYLLRKIELLIQRGADRDLRVHKTTVVEYIRKHFRAEFNFVVEGRKVIGELETLLTLILENSTPLSKGKDVLVETEEPLYWQFVLMLLQLPMLKILFRGWL